MRPGRTQDLRQLFAEYQVSLLTSVRGVTALSNPLHAERWDADFAVSVLVRGMLGRRPIRFAQNGGGDRATRHGIPATAACVCVVQGLSWIFTAPSCFFWKIS